MCTHNLKIFGKGRLPTGSPQPALRNTAPPFGNCISNDIPFLVKDRDRSHSIPTAIFLQGVYCRTFSIGTEQRTRTILVLRNQFVQLSLQ